MLWSLIQKELKAIILSPKFTATFAVCSILMLLSVYIGINEYKADVKQYDTTRNLVIQDRQEKTNWFQVTDVALRKPDPMQIFSAGLNNDIGRWSSVDSQEPIDLKGSNYSNDPIYAVFRFIDFTFIVQVVLSLFAILFTYDAINGEREGGTLQLVFSNAVPRAKFIFAKCLGSWLGLVVPIMIPILLCLLLLMVFRIPMTGEHWTKLLVLIGVSLVFFTFFIALGVLISSLTKRTAVSFLIGLVAWVAFVLIIPRAGVLTAGQLVKVPSAAEIAGLQDTYSKDQWQAFYDEAEDRWMNYNRDNAESEDESDEVDEDGLWLRMQEEDSLRSIVEANIEDYRARVQEDFRRKKMVQEKLAYQISRISPASSYQLAAMSLASTGVELKRDYEDAMNEHRTRFNDYTAKKQKESGVMGGMMITVSTDQGMKISQGREGGTVDVSDVPEFNAPVISVGEAVKSAIVDFGLLSIYTILAFAGAFIIFLRYDVRT